MNHYAVDTMTYWLDQELTAHPAILHKLYTHKALDLLTTERPAVLRPFIAIALTAQPSQLAAPKANSFQQPYRDRTRVAIYVESRLSFADAGTVYGGFDAEHIAAVQFVRDFVASYRALEIPNPLWVLFGRGKVAMTPAQPPEQAIRLKDGERQVFYVLLSYFTTTDDSEATS